MNKVTMLLHHLAVVDAEAEDLSHRRPHDADALTETTVKSYPCVCAQEAA